MLHYCNDHLNLPEDKKSDAPAAETPANLAAGLADAASSSTDVPATATEGSEEKKKEDENDTFQSFAVLGIAIVAMGEDIGSEMSLRHFNHLVRLDIRFIRI